MTAATRSEFRRRLLALKTEILGEGDIEIEPGRDPTAAVGSDEDAQPLTEMAQSIASARNRTRTQLLARIVAALARLDAEDDSFGLCTECDEPIAPRRLDLMPYVELCVECQQSKDAPKSPQTRRHLTDYK